MESFNTASSPKNGMSPKHKLQICALGSSRAILLAAFVYGVWRFGGTEPITLIHTSMALAAAAILNVLAGDQGRDPRYRFPVALAVIASLWIAYAFLQLQPLTGFTEWFFIGPLECFEETAQPEFEILLNAYKRFGGAELLSPRAHGTVALDETRWALVPFLVSLAFSLLAWRLFQSSKSQRALLWAIVLHTGAIGGWGILQHSAGNLDILPGVPNRFSSIPFSSFIYKNAGAAALLPGIASALLLYTLQTTPKTTRQHYGRTRRPKIQRNQVVILLVAAVMAVGLCVSLSRGAWITGVVTTAIVILLAKSNLRLIVAFSSVALLGGLVTSQLASKISTSIQKRTRELSLNDLTNDVRWDHWRDGFATAIQNFPSGSGLGTYGYAVLSNQSDVRRGWFREAHNQYLEILTESGIIGLLILVALFVFFFSTFSRSLRTKSQSNPPHWAIFGIALLMCVMIQNAADFVITIPSNMFLYAILLTIAASRCNSTIITRSPMVILKADLLVNLLTTSIVLLVLFIAGSLSWEKHNADKASEESRILASQLTAYPIDAADVLDKLNDAIETSPKTALLYERRAAWQLYQYRNELILESKKQGESVSWENTHPLNLLRFFETLPASMRADIVMQCTATTELRIHLAKVVEDLVAAIGINSLRPTSHFDVSVLSHLLETDPKQSIAIARRLSNSDADRLFSNGFVYFLIQDQDSMVDQWSRSLIASERHIETIFQLANERLDPIEIAASLVPPNRSDLILRLAEQPIASALSNPPENSTVTERADANLIRESNVERLFEFCKSSQKFSKSHQLAALAGLSELSNNWRRASEYWALALAEEPRNSSYRIRYTMALLRLKECQKSLDQAVLGRLLHPEDRRFVDLEQEARSCVARPD